MLQQENIKRRSSFNIVEWRSIKLDAVVECSRWGMRWLGLVNDFDQTNHQMRYLECSTTISSSIFSFYYDEICIPQTKTNILYINTNHIHHYLVWLQERSQRTHPFVFIKKKPTGTVYTE